MSYPSGPYPQPPSGGYPGYPGGVVPELRPSGATAIIAAILAVLGGLFHLLVGVVGFIAIGQADPHHEIPAVIRWGSIGSGVSLLIGVVLLVGAIMMFVRKPVGRLLVIIPAAFMCLAVLADVILVLIIGRPGPYLFLGMFTVVFPALTLVLASLGSTRRYLRYRPGTPGYPQRQPQGFPPQY